MTFASDYLDSVEAAINRNLSILSATYLGEDNADKRKAAARAISNVVAEGATKLRESGFNDTDFYISVNELIGLVEKPISAPSEGTAFDYTAWNMAVSRHIDRMRERVIRSPEMREVVDLNRRISELYADIILKYPGNIRTNVGVPKAESVDSVSMPFQVYPHTGESADDVEEFLRSKVDEHFPEGQYRKLVMFRGHPEEDTGQPICDVEISITPL